MTNPNSGGSKFIVGCPVGHEWVELVVGCHILAIE